MNAPYSIGDVYDVTTTLWNESQQVSVRTKMVQAAELVTNPQPAANRVVVEYNTRDGAFALAGYAHGAAKVYSFVPAPWVRKVRRRFERFDGGSGQWQVHELDSFPATVTAQEADILVVNHHPDELVRPDLKAMFQFLSTDSVLLLRVNQSHERWQDQLSSLWHIVRRLNKIDDYRKAYNTSYWRYFAAWADACIRLPVRTTRSRESIEYLVTSLNNTMILAQYCPPAPANVGGDAYIAYIPHPLSVFLFNRWMRLSNARIDQLKATKATLSMLHIDALQALDMLVQLTSGTILEIGAFRGGATVTMGTALQNHHMERKLLSVEIGGPFPHETLGTTDTLADLRHNVAAYGVGDVVEVLHGASYDDHVNTRIAAVAAEKPIDLWIIDADGHIERDFQLYARYASPGCYLFIDDYVSEGAPEKEVLTKAFIDKMVEAGKLEALGIVGWGTWVGRLRSQEFGLS